MVVVFNRKSEHVVMVATTVVAMVAGEHKNTMQETKLGSVLKGSCPEQMVVPDKIFHPYP